MADVEVIEVGYGDSARPPQMFGGAKFQAGADWLFRRIRDGAKVRMKYAIGGWPATSDYLIIMLDDEDLEELELIQSRDSNDDTPWKNNYADGIHNFLRANAEQLRACLGLKDEDEDEDEDD